MFYQSGILLRSSALELPRVAHGFSTRLGGVSTDPVTREMNLAFGREDPDAVAFKVRLKAMPAARFLRDRPHLPVYLVDNMVDTGHTARACLKALPSASGVIAVGDTGVHRDNSQEK